MAQHEKNDDPLPRTRTAKNGSKIIVIHATMAVSGCMPTRILGRRRSILIFSALIAFAAIVTLYFTVDNMISQTKTIIGHNLKPTPWHIFDRPPHPTHSTTTIFRCTYLSCRRLPLSSSSSFSSPTLKKRPKKRRSCPQYFQSILRQLEPWKKSRITPAMMEEAKKRAAMRVVIVSGRVYVDLYYACTQSRAMFTIWGLLQLLRRYPGMVPDVDMMFDCMDRPSVLRDEFYGGEGENTRGLPPPPPLFRYCTTKMHYDIPFPDWSFWGWAEINIKPWEEAFKSIKKGSKALTWEKKHPIAYWKGNPDVGSPIRTALLECNDSNLWGAQILSQNWVEEARDGFRKSDLAGQCDYRYKIYAEGFAWSVSLKYILACGSLPLLIDPQYEEFFSRGLVPKVNYLPVNAVHICRTIKHNVDWGNKHPSEAEEIGKRAQELMEELDMDRVYDYMYHLILEYSKLQDFQPAPPPSAQEFCFDSILCLADENQRKFLESSYATPASYSPCNLSH